MGNVFEVIKLAAEFIATVGGAATIICTFLKKQIKKITKDLVTKGDLDKYQANQIKYFDEQHKLLDIKIENLNNRMEEHNNKIEASLLDESRYIFVQAEKVYRNSDTIDDHTYDSLCQLFESYKALNGNGYVHKIMKELELKHLGGE